MNKTEPSQNTRESTVKRKTESLVIDLQEETFRAGYREGRIEARISMIRRMRQIGMNWKTIEQITGLNRDDYRDLQELWPEQKQ